MKRERTFLAAVALAAALPASAQPVPEIPYEANADFLSLPAYGEVAGVATNARGHIFVYARTGHAYATLGDERTFYHGGSRLFQFDPAGKFVKEIGQGTYAMNFAQQVRVDPAGNIWAVDAGANMITVFDPEGFLLKPYGRRPEAINVRPGPGVPARVVDVPPAVVLPPGGGGGGAAAGLPPGAGIPGHSFNRPSDVAFDAAGNAYVADGWGTNNRVAKFRKDGNFVKSWGRTGSAPGQFNEIRGIASDAAGNIYVADAGNRRIQVFDGEGSFKYEFGGIGRPMAICISGGSPQYLFSSNSNTPEDLDYGEIYKVRLTGQVMGKLGRAGKIPREFSVVNALDCRTENDLLVGEVGNWRVQKVTLKR
jgi:DNA-binding beta-propeller fold protein YncE